MGGSLFCGYTIGVDAFDSISKVCMPLGKSVLIIGGKTALEKAGDKLKASVLEDFEIVDTVIYGKECCEDTMKEISDTYANSNVDFIIGVGGGKAIDTAKGVAYFLNKPVVSVPTIASTCAAASALSVVYTKEHVFQKFMHYEKPPYHCFINTEIIAEAPFQFLRAGIGDTAAKYYEVELSARNQKTTYSDEMALSVSRMCNEPLFKDAENAVAACRNSVVNEALENVVRIIIISTGMVSMLINSKFNGAVAHALFYGLTNIEGFEENFLHGDVVGYTTIVQLVLDNKMDEAHRLKGILEGIGIETTLSQRGIIPERNEFEKVLNGAIEDPDMEVLPYQITKDMIFEAILKTENLGDMK